MGGDDSGRTASQVALEELVARDLVLRTPWRGRTMDFSSTVDVELAAVVEEAAPALAAGRPRTPAQTGTVDRSVPLDAFSIDTPVLIGGRVAVVLRRPLGYPAGPLPADQGRFVAGVDPRVAICRALGPGAAARCLGGARYF
jgi:hypothetical protein